MPSFTSLESFNTARFAIRSWDPLDSGTDQLKHQILDFLDIVEKQHDHLLDLCNAQNTEQKQLEMALCHTEDAISIATADGIIRMVNPSFEKLVGIHGSKIIGQNHDAFWDEDDSDRLKHMKKNLTKGLDWRGELTIRAHDGSLYEVQVSVVPIIQPTGAVTHFVFTLHNITERKKLEINLQQQSQFLEKVINLNPSVIIILDEEGRWMLDNLAAKTLLSDLGVRARQNLSDKILLMIREPNHHKPNKLCLQLPGGTERIFLLVFEEIPAKYLLPDSEKNTAYLITLSDITANEKSNRENLVRQKALLSSRIEKNMIQGEFINGFIYHLQKPLNITKAAISRVQSAINHNRLDQVEHAALLIREELEFLENELNKFRFIPQKEPVSEEWTESSELTDAIKVLYVKQYQKGLITISDNTIGQGCYPMPYEIMQLVLKILVDNSFESQPETLEQVRVKISFSMGNGCRLLTVEDSGPGIDHHERYKIFEPFYSSKKNHSGLSLTILHQVLNNIKGHLDLTRSDMGGAKITLYFPMESS